MTTPVDIVNRALQAIGTRTSVSAAELASGSSNEAIQANIALTDVRDNLLRMAPWGCATTAANLELVSAAPGTPENPDQPSGPWVPGVPLPPWLYSYKYPADCLRALNIIPQPTNDAGVPIYPVTSVNPATSLLAPVPFKVASDRIIVDGTDATSYQRVVLTNQRGACLMYNRRVEDPDDMDELFLSAWSDLLASELSKALTGDKKLAQMLIDKANRTVAMAREADCNEGPTVLDSTPDWFRARGVASVDNWFGGVNWGPMWPSV